MFEIYVLVKLGLPQPGAAPSITDSAPSLSGGTRRGERPRLPGAWDPGLG